MGHLTALVLKFLQVWRLLFINQMTFVFYDIWHTSPSNMEGIFGAEIFNCQPSNLAKIKPQSKYSITSRLSLP